MFNLGFSATRQNQAGKCAGWMTTSKGLNVHSAFQSSSSWIFSQTTSVREGHTWAGTNYKEEPEQYIDDAD